MKHNPDKILLIEPPFYRLFKNTFSLDRYPLSLGYLSGTIKKKTEWSVTAYNADFYPQSENIEISYLAGSGFDNYLNNLKSFSAPVWKEIKSTISEHKPTVVGISAKSQNFASACMVAKLAKQINKETIVIVGGPHTSMVGPDALNCPDIDVCVKGEGEKTIVELLNAIENGNGFEEIKGIVYKKGNQTIETPPREFIEDLDSLCFPHEAASEVLKDFDKYPPSAFESIFSTRGCPFNCFFCGSRNIWSRKVRFRSPENVIREIKLLQQKGVTSISFADDTFGANKKYLTDLCNIIIKQCPGLSWSCEIHVKLVNEEIISLMKKAGCKEILLGVESGNNEMLKKIRKNIKIEEAFSATEVIKKHGIRLIAFFMAGFPEETEQTLNDTFTAIKKINCTIFYSIFTPYPGTEAFAFCREKGLIDDKYDVSLYNHQSPANCFCVNIEPARFRELSSQIEKTVDKQNRLIRKKEMFSLSKLEKIRELGIGKSLQKGIKLLLGK